MLRGTPPPSTELLVDADACPVKDEIYAAAARYGLYTVVVANQRIGVPQDLGVEMVVVDDGLDAADDWIAEHVRAFDVVVTADIPLAARCLEKGALVIGTNGRPFTEDSIGGALAMRQLKADLRGAGLVTGGPPPLLGKDRSRFSSALDQAIQRALRGEC